MKKNCFKSFLSLALVVLGLAMPSNAMADAAWTGTAIGSVGTVDSDNPIYLYNEKAEAWFNVGGLWGTQAVTNKDYGISIIGFTANGSYYKMETALQNSTSSGQGHFIGYVLYHTGTEAVDNGLYCDRDGSSTASESSAGVTNFTFEEVNSTTHEYTISCVVGSNTYYVTAPSALRDSCSMTQATTEYSYWKIVTKATIDAKLQTSPATWSDPTNITYVIKDANLFRGSTDEATAWTTSDWNVLTSGSGTASYEAVTSITSGNTYYISDGTNYLTLSGSTIGSTTTASEATAFTVTYTSGYYLIKSGSYYLAISDGGQNQSRSLLAQTSSYYWNFTDGYFYRKPGNNSTYYITYNSGWTIAKSAPSASRTYQLTSGGTSAEGLKFGGEYYKRSLGGSYVDNTSSNPDETINATNTYQRARGKYFGAQVRGASGKVSQTVKVYYSGWYEISCQGVYYNPNKTANNVAYVFANANGTDVTAAFDRVTSDEWDAIQDKFFEKDLYKTTVQVKVTMDNPNAKGYDANGKTISLGVLLKAANAAYDDWTAFDDFQIEFLGDNTELILKENTTDYGYLLNYATEFENCTMYLNRTFTENAWNTLVLPVKLSKSAFIGAFGANARAAELTKVSDGVLHFETIAKNGKDDDDDFLLANRPYIVYIVTNPSETASVTVRYSNSDTDYKDVTIGGADEPYYTVPFVSLDKDNIREIAGAKYKGQTHGAYTLTDGDASVTFNGTLLKTYTTTTATDEEGKVTTTGTITEGFDPMTGHIIFKGGEIYWLTAPYGMKAYRAWLETTGYDFDDTMSVPEGSGDINAKITFSIDGIEDSATYIYDLTSDAVSNATAKNSRVYNVNGQLVNSKASLENLPKGLYIVNGKKYIVK